MNRLMWAPEGTEVTHVDDLMVLSYGEAQYDAITPWEDYGSHQGMIHFSDMSPGKQYHRFMRMENVNVGDDIDDARSMFQRAHGVVIAFAQLKKPQWGEPYGTFFPSVSITSITSKHPWLDHSPLVVDFDLFAEPVMIKTQLGDNSEDSSR